MGSPIDAYQTRAHLNDDIQEITATNVAGNKTALDVAIKEGSVSGTFTPSGLQNGGLITKVTLSTVAWTALPATPLANRNAMSVQNRSGQSVYINYDNGLPIDPSISVLIPPGGERQYDVKDSIIIYAFCSGVAVDVQVEEIS